MARKDIEAAVSAAVAAQPELARQPAHRRGAWLNGIAAGIAARKEALVDLIVGEAKKPIQYARGEVDRAVATFTFAADEARRLGGEVIPIDAAPGGDGRLGVAVRVPRGPVSAITPFNFPLNLPAHKIAPAIACGAALIHKPSPETPGAALELARIARAAGVPEDAYRCVEASNEDAAPLIDDERMRVLSFTGSGAAGWALKARAGTKHVLLELGGNAPVIVLPDADLTAILPKLVAGAFAYAGQVCIKAQRLIFHEAIYDEAERAFTAAVEKLAVVGDVRRPDVMVGPLIRTRDADRVAAWIAEALQQGARLLTGGRREGDTIWPTVLAGVHPDSKVHREEVFGPVVVLEKARDLDDAIRRANDSQYGLQAGVFTRDHGALMRCFRELTVGAVIHDDVPTYRADHMPYGGAKLSGTGREGPRYAIEEMTELRLLVMRA
jgi:acyl-CoA reductase-like NAD-dependent aldehyde dehydrogenase